MPEALPEIETWDLLLRVLGAALLGGLVGVEREFSDQPAGFRTHILVSLGAALFTLVGAYGISGFFGGSTPLELDPTRIAAQVVTGIGFLGAGAIIQQGLNVRGLTTAAALWVTAAIGTAVAFGYWTGAIATTLLTVVALYGLKRVEKAVFPRLKRGRFEYRIDVHRDLPLAKLVDVVEAHRARVAEMRIEDEEEGRTRVAATVFLPSAIAPDVLAQEMRRLEGVREVSWGS